MSAAPDRLATLAQQLTRGMVFVEVGIGPFVVTEAARIEGDELRWVASPLAGDKPMPIVQPYLITRGFEHYGPRVEIIGRHHDKGLA